MRKGSIFDNTLCSYKGSGFYSQHLHLLQFQDLLPCSGLYRHHAHSARLYILEKFDNNKIKMKDSNSVLEEEKLVAHEYHPSTGNAELESLA